MVCKEDVVTWFKSLKSYKRIDVMCTLLNLNLPFELRFLGTCLEDLGKRDFHDLRNSECGANSPSEIGSLDIQCISDKNARTKLVVYITLLRSCNYECAKGLYKILTNVEEIYNILKSNLLLNPDDETLEELLLLYTLAVNHPAFTFEQKLSLSSILSKLQDEHQRISALTRSRPVVGTSGLETINDKVPLQHYQSCPSPEQGNLHLITNTSHCTPLSSSGEQLLSMPEQLNAVGYLRFNYSAPLVAAPWSQVVMSNNDPHTSPLVSRTSSPCQSNSPSRAGSPGKHKTASIVTNFQRPPPRSEPVDPLRDTQLANLKKYTLDQLNRMCDDELRELGLPIGAIQQFRSIFNKAQSTNGLTNIIDGVKKSPDTLTSESNELSLMRQYGSADVTSLTPAPGLMYAMGPPPGLCTGTPPCLTCVIGSRGPHNKSLHPQFSEINHQMKGVCLDAESSLHTSNSSASDSASDHSPPDTPSLSIAMDRGPPTKDTIPSEMWNHIGGEEQQRIGDGSDERRIGVHTHPPLGGRARGLGRSSRSNPPGIQTVSRGRGPNGNTNRRREINSSANVMNGGPEERKVFSGNESTAPYPFSPTAPNPYIPPGHFMRSAAYPFGPGSFVRTATFPFPHPNGDIVYQFPPPPPQPFLPSGPAPGPNPLTFSPMTAPPPKISCYNCGSQSHLSSDCQEPTMEEITKQGQYRIDYNPNTNPKSGECSSSNQDKLQ